MSRLSITTVVFVALCACGDTRDESDANVEIDAAMDDASSQTDAADGGLVDDAGHPLLSRDEEIAPGPTCEFGGHTTYFGVDDGEGSGNADDGVLDPAEEDGSNTLCDTAPDPNLIAATGLDVAAPNATCRVPIGSSSTEGVRTAPMFAGVLFPPNAACNAPFNDTTCANAFRPVALVQHPVSRAFYVAEQTGRILRIPENAASGHQAAVALNIEGKVVFGYEPGLLNLVFDPSQPNHAFITYVTCESQLSAITNPSCSDGEGINKFLVVSRFTLDPSGDVDPASERLVLEVAKPRTEHNGGGATFGPDGMLYVGLGDGGDFPSNAAQSGASLLGKLLRIDVHDAAGDPLESPAAPYRIPANNPFVSDGNVRDEIYALGFRNPWRYAFDPLIPLDGLPRAWIGDVGLVTAEEIDYVEPGRNYGWPIREGNFCRPTGDDANRVTVLSTNDCDPLEALTPPVHTYVQAEGVSITGGVVYRGSAIPSLQGAFIFSDFSRGQIRRLDAHGTGEPARLVTETNAMLSSFAEDLDGEVYYFHWWTGEIRKLVPVDASASRPATRLSETGCVLPGEPRSPASGAIRYAPNAPFYSEREISKERYLFLPTGSSMTEYADSGTLILPVGTVIMKTFDVGARRIETRLMFRHPDGEWSFWSYRWLEDQSDALLVEDAGTETFDGVEWQFPSRAQCAHCHTYPTGRLLGVRVPQLNGLHYYTSTGRWANQIDTFRALQMINRVVAPNPNLPIGDGNAEVIAMPPASTLGRTPRLDDASVPLRDRVGAYLEINCSHCHRPAGGARGSFDLRASAFLGADSGICDTPAQSEAYDLVSPRVLVPGDAASSVLFRRLAEETLPYRMHPYRRSVDTSGLSLIEQWIEQDSVADCLAN